MFFLSPKWLKNKRTNVVKIILDVFTILVNFKRMKLKDYLVQNKLKPSDFAGQIGVTVQTLYRYIGGERMPRPAIMEKIRQSTEGAVTAADFYQ
jgi:predicted transcriptional regulator